jgi:uncharacterized membrane protein YbhN (UPF0104 family)
LPLVGPGAAEFWGSLWLYRSRPGALTAALFLAVLGHLGFVLNFYFAAQMFPGTPSGTPSLLEHLLIIPAGQLFQSVFPSPGGLGGGEFGFAQMYALVGKPEAQGVLGSLAVRVITWALCLAGWLFYLGTWPSSLMKKGSDPYRTVSVSRSLEGVRPLLQQAARSRGAG